MFIVPFAILQAHKKTFYGIQGILWNDWNTVLQQNRRIATHAIMMVGEQRKQIEALMQEEAEKLVDKLNSYKGKPIDPEIDLKTAVINIISALVDTYYHCAVLT